MADSDQIKQAMQSLGVLWGAEHAEKDDAGVTQIERLTKLLRKFHDHEAKEHADDPNKGLREATYQSNGQTVYYDDGPGTLQDAADLYAVLDESHTTGSPNLENAQAKLILDKLQSGGGLGVVHLDALQKLLAKHAAKIAKLRKSPDREGQDMLDAEPGPDSLITN